VDQHCWRLICGNTKDLALSASTNEGGNEYGLGEAAFATSECMRWEWAAIENSNEVGFGFGVLDMGKRKVPDTNLI